MVTFLLVAGKMTVTPVGASIKHNCQIKKTNLGLVIIVDQSVYLARGTNVEAVYTS